MHMKNIKNPLLRMLMRSASREVENYRKESPGYGRREFIKKSGQAMAGAALMYALPSVLVSCKNTRAANPDEEILDVAILGAGISGLNCANHLLPSGLEFKLFEADSRVGGRILTHRFDALGLGIHSEFGGDFIDSNHLEMIALAKEFNLELIDLIEEQQKENWVKDIYFFDNRKISGEEIIQEFKKIAPKIAEDAASLGENYDTADAKILDNLPLSEYIDSLHCASWLKELFVAAWIAEYGLDCEEMSSINMLDMLNPNTDDGFFVFGESDERFRIKGGNSKIIEALTDKIGEEKIEKGFQVHTIKELDDHSYEIYFTNDQVIKAKAIVCTIPFTILRDLKLDVKNMSAAKRKCIDELGYGHNTKLILGYDSQPWRNEKNRAMGYLFTNDMTNGWDGSVNKPENNSNGAYVAYFGGKYSQNLSENSSKSPLAPPTHSWRTQLPEEKVNEFVDELDKIFVDSKKHFTGKHIFVNWLEYPFVRASYSCYKTGQWTTIAGLEAEPVGNLFFSGEHCSTDFQGFMNGAAESGRNTAKLIVEKYLSEQNATMKPN